jgi:hypothetical protein
MGCSSSLSYNTYTCGPINKIDEIGIIYNKMRNEKMCFINYYNEIDQLFILRCSENNWNKIKQKYFDNNFEIKTSYMLQAHN